MALSEKQAYSWRAAWLLWSCISKNDKRIRKHIRNIVDVLPNRHDNQQRELLLVLQRMELNLDIRGRLFDICSNIWKTPNKNSSLRFHAFKTMIEIAKMHPDLLREINTLTDPPYIDNFTENVKKSIFKMLNNIDVSHNE